MGISLSFSMLKGKDTSLLILEKKEKNNLIEYKISLKDHENNFYIENEKNLKKYFFPFLIELEKDQNEKTIL